MTLNELHQDLKDAGFPKEWFMNPVSLEEVTEEMRQFCLKNDVPMLAETHVGLVTVETLDKPLPPLDGLMFCGTIIRVTH